jgi:two-component system, probable response regulator PhcQ
VAQVAAAVTRFPHTVLVVDDEPSIVAALRRTLRGRGYRIFGVTSPAEALEVLAAEPVDLVISDIDMPEMSGLDLVARVRREQPAVVRVLLTGRGTLDAALRAINDGEVHRFLTKPWDDDELREIVAQALVRLEELRRAQAADQTALRRRAFISDLETEQPGIAKVERDGDGVYVLDERRIEALRARVGPELARLLD